MSGHRAKQLHRIAAAQIKTLDVRSKREQSYVLKAAKRFYHALQRPMRAAFMARHPEATPARKVPQANGTHALA